LPRIRGHASSPLLFFFLSTRFATLLTFVFRSFPKVLASSASSPAPAEPFRRRRPTLQQHPRPAPRREHRRHSSGRSLSPWTVIQAAVLKQAFYDSKGTSPSTRPLPSSRRRRSAPSPTRTSSSLERRVLSERLPRNGVLCRDVHQFPSPSISLRQLVSKFASALAPSCHHLSPDLEERRTSGRRSRLSQVMCVLFFVVLPRLSSSLL
jgi:hypothetical protein